MNCSEPDNVFDINKRYLEPGEAAVSAPAPAACLHRTQSDPPGDGVGEEAGHASRAVLVRHDDQVQRGAGTAQ